MTGVGTFAVTVFCMFSKPHFCLLSGLTGTHTHHFDVHVRTKLLTI